MGAACCVAARSRDYNHESSTDVAEMTSSHWADKFQSDVVTSPRRCVQFQRAISLNNRSNRIANSWDHHARENSAVHSVESSPLSVNAGEPQWLNSPAVADHDGRSIATPSDSVLSPCLTEGSSKEGCSNNDFYPQIGTPESFLSSGHFVDSLQTNNKGQGDLQQPTNESKSSCRHASMRNRSLFFRRSQNVSSNYLSRQISDSRIHALNPRDVSFKIASEQQNSFKFSGSESSTSVPHSGVPDWWSMQTFSDLVASSRREHYHGIGMTSPDIGWSSGRESTERASMATERIRANNLQKIPLTSANDTDVQTCGICSKRLSFNLSVVAVLVCGHVYHADCLEQTTSDADHHDPACPLCNTKESKSSRQIPSPLEQVIKWKGAGLKAFRSQSQSSTRNKGSRVTNDELMHPQFYSGEILLSNGDRLSALAGANERETPNKSIFRRHFSLRGKSKEEHNGLDVNYKIPKLPKHSGESSSGNRYGKKGIFRF